MIKYIEDISSDNDAGLIKAQEKHRLNCQTKILASSYRVYVIDGASINRGFWINDGHIYKDKISFKAYKDYTRALNHARYILKTTTEQAVSIEDVKLNILYIIYKDKTEILKIKYTLKSLNKRHAVARAIEYTRQNGGATLEYKAPYYIIASYKAGAIS